MPRPPQPVLLPWLQPGGLEPPLRPLLCPVVNPDDKPPLKLAPPPCPPPWPPRSANAGAVMPTPTTTAAISAAAAIRLAITPPPPSSCWSRNASAPLDVPPSPARGPDRPGWRRHRRRGSGR